MLRMQLVTEQVRLLFGSINDTGGFSRQCHSIEILRKACFLLWQQVERHHIHIRWFDWTQSKHGTITDSTAANTYFVPNNVTSSDGNVSETFLVSVCDATTLCKFPFGTMTISDAPPKVTITGPDEVLSGKVANFTANAAGGSGGYSYAWAISGASHTIPIGDDKSSTLFVEFKEPSLTVAKLIVNILDSRYDRSVDTKDVTIKPDSLVIAPIANQTYLTIGSDNDSLIRRSPIHDQVKLIRLMLQRSVGPQFKFQV